MSARWCKTTVGVAAAIAILLCATIVPVQSRTSDILRVRLADGSPIVGRYLRSHDGHGIRAFMGIPYAQPPLGELRFRPPVRALPWTADKQTVKDSTICIQRDPYRRDQQIEGSEDCLYLNVYAPLRPSTAKPLAVMVYFHGGGFQCGSGISAFYGPDHLLDHEIVYVGANFRLGPLGFLSTENGDAVGNWGLKDQVMVLQWVQDNIGQFGGDAKLVTIFGESAGGASVTYHMQSKMSKGLFHRAISQSGTNLDSWARPAHPGVAVRRARHLAGIVGCDSAAPTATLIECLRTIEAATVTAAFYDFYEWDYDPMIPFPPVVEPDLPGAFIVTHPKDVARPHGLSVPWLTGLTSEEGALKTAAILYSPELYADFNENFDRALPIALNYDHHPADVQRQMTARINQYYFGNQGRLTADTHQNLTDLFTDGWFGAGMDEYTEKRLGQELAGPTYVYLFAHKGESSFTEIFQGGREEFYGTCHAEELQYLFPIGKDLFISAAPTETDTLLRQTLVALWVNFARSGNPTPPPAASGDHSATSVSLDRLGVPAWTPATRYPLNFLRIGNKDAGAEQPLIAMEIGLMDERLEFWRKLQAHAPAKTTTATEKTEL